MTNHDTPEAQAVLVEAGGESGHSYCCECGTYDAHKSRCLCCGFDFRSGPEAGADA